MTVHLLSLQTCLLYFLKIFLLLQVVCRIIAKRNVAFRGKQWSFHSDQMELFHWLVFYFCTSCSKLISSKLTSAWVKFKMTRLWFCIILVEWKHNNYRLQFFSTILSVMWLQFLLKGFFFNVVRWVWPGSNERQEGSLVLVICLGSFYSIIKNHSSLKKKTYYT